MGTRWLLIPAPNWPRLNDLADGYERTGQGEAELAATFQQTVEIAEVLASYVLAMAGRPSQS